MNTKPRFFKSMTLVALFFMVAAQLHAQQNYKLSDYVNPDYRYQSLDFNMNFSAVGNIVRYETVGSYLSKNHASNVGGNFGISFNQIKNTARYQGYQISSLSFDGAWSNTATDYNNIPSDFYSSTTKAGSLIAGFGYSSTNRFYNTRKQFLEVDPQVSLNLLRSTNKQEENPVNYPFFKYHLGQSNSLSISIPVSVGMGRIENVQNARLALYILNDLQKSGDVKKNLSNEQVDQLARFITQLRNKRFFDSRLQNIAEITSVDSLLTAMGLREHAGAGYFMTLNDDWNYANGPVRLSGHRFGFGVTPGYSNTLDRDTQDHIANAGDPVTRSIVTNKGQTMTLDINAYYYLERPVSLTWQHSTAVSFGYEPGKTVDDNTTNSSQVPEDKTTFYNPNLHFMFEKTYGYYPNSRTNLALDVTLLAQYYMKSQNNTSILKSNQLSLYGSAMLRGNYYFSPQLRLNLDAGVSEQFQHFDNNPGTSLHDLNRNNFFSPSISLSLLYSIF